MGALKGDSNSALCLFNLSGYGKCSVAQAILFCNRVLQGVCDGVGYRHCTACEEHEKKCDHQVFFATNNKKQAKLALGFKKRERSLILDMEQ